MCWSCIARGLRAWQVPGGMKSKPPRHRWVVLQACNWAAALLGSAACGERTQQLEPAPQGSEVMAAPVEPVAPESAEVRRSLCPGCPGRNGGESSDFGTPHTCILAERTAPIDRARAAELQFDVEDLERRVARSFQAPLRWTPGNSRLPPPRGYEPDTWVEGDVTMTGYNEVSLDPALCNGNDCTLNGERWQCSDRLVLDVRVNLRTLDGAVAAQLSGYVLVGRPGFSFSETPAGTMFASLSDATGSLELFADQLPTLRSALLLTDLRFGVDDLEGTVRVLLLQGAPDVTFRTYEPISGHWPEPR